MKLSHLLAQHARLVRQARLANLALAYHVLDQFVQRTSRAGITGRLRLQSAAPEEDRFVPTLTPLDGNPSVVEEHFTDADIIELVDIAGFVLGTATVDHTFRVDGVTETLLLPLRAELEREGVELDDPAHSIGLSQEG